MAVPSNKLQALQKKTPNKSKAEKAAETVKNFGVGQTEPKESKKNSPPEEPANSTPTTEEIIRERITTYVTPDILDSFQTAAKKERRNRGGGKELDRSYFIEEAMKEWLRAHNYPTDG